MFKVTYPSVCVLAVCVLATTVLAQDSPSTSTTPAPPDATTSAAQTCAVLDAKPTPEVNKYVVEPCIVAQFAGYLSIGPGQFIDLKNGQRNQDSSSCGGKNQTQLKLAINFECASMEFIIERSGTKTFVSSITGMYRVNSTDHPIVNTSEMFAVTQSGHFYKCNAEQSIPIGDKVHLVLSNLAIEAFRTASGNDFYQIPEECSLDVQPVSDLVRIAVGVCLVVLVVIVLIAYFIGRRRWSERSSYESV